MTLHKGRLAFACSSSVTNKVLDLMPPILVAWVIDSLRGENPVWLTTDDPWMRAVILASLAVLIFLFESIFQWMYQFGFQTLAQTVQHELRLETYNKIQQREIEYFENLRLGEAMAVVNDDVNQLERFLNSGFNEVLQLITLFVFAGTVLFSTSWQLALVGLMPIPLILGGSFYYQKLIAPRYKKVREAVASVASRLENNLSGIQVIKSFTAEEFESGRMTDASAQYLNANTHAIRLSTVYVPVIRMAVALGFGAVLLLGSYWILEGKDVLTIGELVLFSMMVQRLLWPLVQLGRTFDEYQRADVSAKRVFDLMDAEPKIRNAPVVGAKGRAKGNIALEEVTFEYERGGRVLSGISFSLEAGESVGIAGPTGSGKSTLIKLLLRFYDPVSGVVKLDGTDLKLWDLTDLRRNIALVSQDVYLFHGTVLDNLVYASGVQDLDLIYSAAKKASLHDFIQTLPEGYDTLVGERGIKLSGGQRQRLSIARALLKDAPVLILDEATSSVDTETEKVIQSHLDEFTENKTSLIIAHRLSTIRHSNRILLMKNGAITEEGSHDELIRNGGDYADLWNVQSGGMSL